MPELWEMSDDFENEELEDPEMLEALSRRRQLRAIARKALLRGADERAAQFIVLARKR